MKTASTIKNQWGWRLQHARHRALALSARGRGAGLQLVELVRAAGASEDAPEAITSRPKLLSAVGKLTSHAGQKKVLLSVTHEAGRTDQAADRQCPRGV
ncbi:MAG: hypothetical protein U5L74_13290 [Ideonella sp.]|nr:hypothetical protein [Ideonella sp.]